MSSVHLGKLNILTVAESLDREKLVNTPSIHPKQALLAKRVNLSYPRLIDPPKTIEMLHHCLPLPTRILKLGGTRLWPW